MRINEKGNTHGATYKLFHWITILIAYFCKSNPIEHTKKNRKSGKCKYLKITKRNPILLLFEVLT